MSSHAAPPEEIVDVDPEEIVQGLTGRTKKQERPKKQKLKRAFVTKPHHATGKNSRNTKGLDEKAVQTEVMVEKAESLNVIAKNSLGKSQLAIFEYAVSSYERLQFLIAARKRVEERLFGEEVMSVMMANPAALAEYWKILETSINASVSNLQDINKMAAGYELIKGMIDKYSTQDVLEDVKVGEMNTQLKTLLDKKLKELYPVPASVMGGR